jgi:2,3-bisphosphoglycerate-dependent phosphoglycerate mutase
MKKLILLRHGESQWNLENKFTGWTDVGLTKKGEEEAKESGRLIKNQNLCVDTIHTSLLERAKKTMEICLKEMGVDLKKISINYNWRLNERHYGALQGLNKSETAQKYGDKQVHIWRRSYSTPPPALSYNDKRHPRFDKKYSSLNEEDLPTAECLRDTVSRFLPYWNEHIKKDLESGKKILIVAHGNSLRALIKFLDKISDKDILNLNIPTGSPIVYELDDRLTPMDNYYLGDQDLIAKRKAEVLNQGRNKII